MAAVKRIFVEKKSGFDIAADHLFKNLKDYLGLNTVTKVRILIRYDVEGLNEEDYRIARTTIFSEPPVDYVYDETCTLLDDEQMFAIEYLPGQYDQRADSAAQSIQIMTHGAKPDVKCAQVIILKGKITDQELTLAKKYLINPVDSHEATLDKLETLHTNIEIPDDVMILNGFINMTAKETDVLRKKLALAMSDEDILHCQKYFRDDELRDPTITEIRMLDTYWSDHCRHTTFLSKIQKVDIEKGKYSAPINDAYNEYKKSRKYVYGDQDKPMCLMDIALVAMKELHKSGQINDIEISREINACSIVVNAEMTDGTTEPWLVMFKNETHNHPTEIEPFGGAATCLGGAIRDPLSGRSYVYQAMRVTGAGDPRRSLSETISGKLPQRKITTEAAHGYSSYGNQIGIATGIVSEIYDDGYLAKRMEIGAVIAAAPQKNVFRGEPAIGDIVVLVGGRTGRDGCGGATGSSKSHTTESLKNSGAEVQKGNPPTERKVQRLFRNSNVSKIIKVCNDFGAGGVSVAIGEIADSLVIDLDAVSKKYEGLDGTELAISESQERMAVLLDRSDVKSFIKYAEEENLEAIKVAEVTDTGRMEMFWRKKKIVDLKRSFIETNGVMQNAEIIVTAPAEKTNVFYTNKNDTIENRWKEIIADLNVCSQRGLVECFDSTIGAGSILLPFGGKYRMTPTEAMAAKLPVLFGDTKTATLMSWGYNTTIAHWSPFHSACYAVIESVAKVVAAGGDYKKVRLTLQEYFEKLLKDPKKWGKPFSALLGAFIAQKKIGIPAIGGKDSMSGTFENINVPPTLVSFAVAPVRADNVISPEFKGKGNTIIKLSCMRDTEEMPDFSKLCAMYDTITSLINQKKIISAYTIGNGGIAASITKMCFGNRMGISFHSNINKESLFSIDPGSIVVEVTEDIVKEFDDNICTIIGSVTDNGIIYLGSTKLVVSELQQIWEEPLESIYPVKANEPDGTPLKPCFIKKTTVRPLSKIAKPRIFIPVFPGTNCEYDTARCFDAAGGITETFVINNLSPKHIDNSLSLMATHIDNSQIIMIPGGFSAGDEPEGSGKFIAALFRNQKICDAVMRLINERDGLILGICNGFQALVKLGLLPYGEIRDIDETCPTLTFNNIGRHQSQMVSTRISSTLSPWLANVECGSIHSIAISHGEGRFVANDNIMQEFVNNGQIATQYVDEYGEPTYRITGNPNGSLNAIEGITSYDGRIFGKMGHSERIGCNIAKNIQGDKNQNLFESGILYFQ